MGKGKGSDGGVKHRHASEHRIRLYERAKEVIEFLMDNDGHSPLTAGEFAGALAARYGRVWTRMDGTPNRQLLTEVKQLMHDQHQDPEAFGQLGGFMLDYSPTAGGLTLIGALGEMKHEHLLHLLAGYLHQQRSISTILRRAVAQFRTAAEQAARADDFLLTSVLSKIEDQVDRQGSVDLTLIEEFERLIAERGVTL